MPCSCETLLRGGIASLQEAPLSMFVPKRSANDAVREGTIGLVVGPSLTHPPLPRRPRAMRRECRTLAGADPLLPKRDRCTTSFCRHISGKGIGMADAGGKDMFSFGPLALL